MPKFQCLAAAPSIAELHALHADSCQQGSCPLDAHSTHERPYNHVLATKTYLELLPLAALPIVCKLLPCDSAVSILGEVNAQHIVIHIPEGKGCHCCKANIESNHHPPHKSPGADQVLSRAAWWLVHDVQICTAPRSDKATYSSMMQEAVGMHRFF